MYLDKIKKPLFQQIYEYMKVGEDLEKIEKRLGLSSDGLIDQDNKEYGALLDKLSKIGNEIGRLIAPTKYFPIFVGLHDIKLKDTLSIFTRHEIIKEKHVEEFLDYLLELKNSDIKRRLKNVKPLLSLVDIDSSIRVLYAEVVSTYTFGSFKASCALSRVIVESIAKRYIDYMGFKNLLTGEDKSKKCMSIPNILVNKLSLSGEIINLYSKIAGRADNILHIKEEKVEEEDALKSIELLQEFIEKFPKTL